MVTVATFSSLAEAGAAMGPGARFMGGGTLLMQMINYGTHRFDRLVRCTDPELRSVRPERGSIEIGAAVTMAAVSADPALRFLAPAAARVGGPAIRNMATLGGNLFAAPPFGDLAAALLALDGQVRFADGSETSLETVLSRREADSPIVRSVTIRRPEEGEFRFRKLSRVKPKGVSVLSAAAHLPARGGRISGARIVFSAMGPAPLRARSAESALEGAELTAASIGPALDAALDGLSPGDDALASQWYRREVAPVLLRRLLLDPQ